MISTIISVVVLLYCGYLALIWVIMFISLIIGVFSGDREEFGKLFGLFLYFNGSLGFGLTLGVFIFGNLLNFMTEGQFAIQIINTNKVGIILLVSSVTFYLTGKVLMREKEEEKQKHKYVTLKSGKRVQIY
jgi:hypothetical protein